MFLMERNTKRSLILSHECHYRELDVSQPYAAMYDLDTSLYDDNNDVGDVGSIAAFPEGTIDKRGLAYSQWRKSGKRAMRVRISATRQNFHFRRDPRGEFYERHD